MNQDMANLMLDLHVANHDREEPQSTAGRIAPHRISFERHVDFVDSRSTN